MNVARIAYAVLLVAGCVLVITAAVALCLESWRGRQETGRELAARLQSGQRSAPPAAGRPESFDVVVFFGAFGIAFCAHWVVSAATGSADLTESGQRALMDAVIATAALVLARMRAPTRTRQWPGVRRGWAAYLLAALLGTLGALAA
ncbi:MAG: hypothetical protein ACTHOD_12965 [Motilibacteraceae bacterium]